MATRPNLSHAKRQQVIAAATRLLRSGRFADAAQGVALLLAHNRDDADALHLRGIGAMLQERWAAALDSLETAVGLMPERAIFLASYGVALLRVGRVDEARDVLIRATDLDDKLADAWANLASAHAMAAQPHEAAVAAKRACALKPESADILSAAVAASIYDWDTELDEITEMARRYGALASRDLPAHRPHANTLDAERPIRVGLVSADLRSHPVGRFLQSVLGNIDKGRVKLLAYSNHTDANEDPLTRELRSYVDAWHSIGNLGDEAAASLIRSGTIDILIDLSGHTVGHRLGVFARSPAPVAVTWLGYPGTTGLPSIDYILGNAWTLPEGEDSYYVERAWRLPGSYNCYTPPAGELKVSAPPHLTDGNVTFGSANNFRKFTDATIATWSRILEAVPGSRLVLRSSAETTATTNSALLQRFAKAGAEPQRIRIDGKVPDYQENMARYGEIDIALDPFPYTGATTTVEALYMGVPVLTLRGKGYAALQGVSILENAGLSDWVASSTDDYVNRAILAARNVGALTDIRKRLRDQVLASPLYDGKRLARELEQAFRQMWIEYCRKMNGG